MTEPTRRTEQLYSCSLVSSLVLMLQVHTTQLRLVFFQFQKHRQSVSQSVVFLTTIAFLRLSQAIKEINIWNRHFFPSALDFPEPMCSSHSLVCIGFYEKNLKTLKCLMLQFSRYPVNPVISAAISRNSQLDLYFKDQQ